MSRSTSELTHLSTVHAAMFRHHGPDDFRTRQAASKLRLARIRAEIDALTEAERAELISLLRAA